MGKCFHGWRRKAGCVTLLMACVFAAGWVRNYTVQDMLLIRRDQEHFHLLVSGHDGLIWMKIVDVVGFSRGRPFYDTDVADQSDPFEAINAEWRWKWLGFQFGQGEEIFQTPIGFWIIPYWAIVIPLSLISAYLLLCQPRQSTPKKITEPTVNEGT